MATIQTKTYLLSIVILNYKTPDLTLDLLKSLGKNDDTQIILIDNSPTIELAKKIKSEYKYVTYIINRANIGFAAGVNMGIDTALGNWIFILNSDTLITIKDIRKLLDICKENKSLVATPLIVGKNGVPQKTVGYFDTFSKHPINWLFARPRFINLEDIHKVISVDVATGTALLAHRSLFSNIGKLDEKYFMYFEDIDLSYRLHQKKIGILFVPQVKLVHYGGMSADQNISQKNTNYSNARNLYLTKYRTGVICYINRIFPFFR